MARTALFKRLREPEVEHLHNAVGAQLDVRRLQIAVDDALLVRRLERLGNLPRDWQRFVERKRPAPQTLGQVFAIDELHRDERGYPFMPLRPVQSLQPIDVRDVRMVQRRKDLRLTFEPCQAISIERKRFREDLERHIAIELRVSRAIHFSHSARADRADDFVRPQSAAGN
jgi:hypothetical protein